MQYLVSLISEQKLKAFTSVNFNVSPADLQPYVLQAQDLWLQAYLGSTFYDQLRDQVRANTLSTANRDFLDDFVGPALCNYALWKAMPFLKYKMFNKSVLSPTGENAGGISIDEMKYLRQEILNTAESYMQKGVTYLQNHPSLFSAYVAPLITDGAGVLPIRGRIFVNSFVTPKRRGSFKDFWQYDNDCTDCYEKNGPST